MKPSMQPPTRGMTAAIRVAIADANLMGCGLISGHLKKRFHVVGYATSESTLLRLIETASPDVVLVASHLEDGNLSGLLVVPQIQSKYPAMRVVVLLDRSERELVVQAFRGGALGVFDRSQSHVDRLCKCIVCIHQGQIWANAQQLKFVVDALAQAPSPWVADADGVSLLTKREEDLVRLVADGLGNREIARKLNLSEHTIKNYMFRVFDKLGISNRVELVLYALNSSRRPGQQSFRLHDPGESIHGTGSEPPARPRP